MAYFSTLVSLCFFVSSVFSVSAPIVRTAWTATADSSQGGNPPSLAIDGNMNSFWHSQYNPNIDTLPNWIQVDMKQDYNIHAIAYTPRQDGQANGRIGGHNIDISTDGNNWETIASGAWLNDGTTKKSTFITRRARYVRLTALSEAQGQGFQFTSVAEFNVYHEVTYDYLQRGNWRVSADSEEMTSERSPAFNAIDGDRDSIWHTKYGGGVAALPHWFRIDAGAQVTVSGLSYLPRGAPGNGRIGQYRIETSNDGNAWTTALTGAWPDDDTEKIALFRATARYFRLNALTEAGNRGQWTTAREINLVRAEVEAAAPTLQASKGLWGRTINFPLVPAAVALLPNGKILLWSSYARDTFGGANGYTQTAIYDPATGQSTQRTVANTQHDMFCPGISMDFEGRIVVSGGSNAAKTSIYDPFADRWTAGPNMQTARGYQVTATGSDGRIFNIGGSWAGAVGRKNGEVYSPRNNAWTSLPQALVAPMLTRDREGVYRADNHGWLFAWKGTNYFQAGPSRQMNWYDANGQGTVVGAGNRGDDGDAMCGNAVMYDAVAGKILTAGGGPDYQDNNARSNAYIITLGAAKQNPAVQKVPNMAFARGFANGVALPDGTVFIGGGQSFMKPFSDDTSHLSPEIFNPATNTWTQMNPHAIPRTYHSSALLLPDATVMLGGGGLCAGCGTNHFDAEIFTPPYLLNADGSRRQRPVINTVTGNARIGTTVTVTTNGPIRSFSLIRFGTATHTVNTDSRRIPLAANGGGGNSYTINIPGDPGVTVPGYWLLFALNANGTPSMGRTIKLTP